MYEHRKEPLLSFAAFKRRVSCHIFLALLVLAVGLGVGVLGYHYLGALGWIDSLLNASMILAGMGPVDLLPTATAKVFASFYALFSSMKTYITTVILAAISVVAQAATPEQEKAFVASYKKALEAKDTAALKAFLYTEGATKDTIELFSMMQESNAGSPITSIELVTPTKEELAKFNKPMAMPDGKKYKMPFAPTKELVITIEKKDGDNTSKSTSKNPVGEKNGKLLIPVPVPAK